jgi:site-specific recombinase
MVHEPLPNDKEETGTPGQNIGARLHSYDLTQIRWLQKGFREATDPMTRLGHFGDLGDWLHKSSGLWGRSNDTEFAMRNLRVGALLKELNKDPEFAKSFQMALRESLEKGSVLHLLCASGLPREHGFYGDLIERLLSFALPQSPEPNNVSDLLSHLFPSPDDSAWILSWGKAEFAALRHRVGASVLTDSEHTLISIPELPASFKTLAAAVVSCAFSDDVLRRLRSFDNGPDLFIELMDATTTFVGRLKDFGDDNTQLITLVQDGEIFIRRIAAARARSHQILAKMESVGASLPLVYRLERMLAILDRMERLATLVTANDRTVALQSLVAHLVEGIHSDRSIRILLQRNLSLVARNIVERISESGETYIARTYAQWKTVLKGAAGGGALTCFTGAIKLAIGAAMIPPLLSGLAASLNYAISFVLLQFLHFKLATKQPAFFAGAIAAKISRTSSRVANRSSDALMNELKCIARSQSATFVGNLVFVVPTCFLFDLAWLLATGHSFLDLSEARKVFESMHPLTSGTVWYASVTGLILFFSSLAGSWFQNFLNNRGVPEGVMHSRWLIRTFGQQRADRLAMAISQSSGGIGTSIALGFMLGFFPILGVIGGLPLDVRHVTLSMAQLTLAMASPGIFGFELGTTLWGLLGIVIIGIANFGVSFVLSLWLALRSRGLHLPDALTILRSAAQTFARQPLDFLVPKRND